MTQQEISKASSFEAVRARLLALAYRMLGSRAEAEDVVQDVWLKWHLAETEEVQTPIAWLTTLTTRTAIDRLRRLQHERASQSAGWLPEPWLDEVAPSAEDLALRAAEMSYGVMLLLERLKPDERAAFVLHEAFECDYAEIAEILQRTPAACRQIVHRAKNRLQRAGAPLQRPDAAAHAKMVERLRAALETQDRVGLVRLFSVAPEVVCDSRVFVSAHTYSLSRKHPEPVSEAVDQVRTEWVEKIASLARHASSVEVVSVQGSAGVALLREGEVVAVIDVSTKEKSNGGMEIVAMHAVTHAVHLRFANRLLGRAAVVQLLARIRRHTRSSVTVCRDFPVDVHT
ncbi:sigma-70 family RNA polymerase sigma factor [Paraburkholderia sp. PREW-6R]|uniref:sigma-70 family RNA polymerase sigma factor n=1 Tax=Paraburkholderia sp. PREW-6R TaxID=3141544 RepID=UPI0031F539A0